MAADTKPKIDLDEVRAAIASAGVLGAEIRRELPAVIAEIMSFAPEERDLCFEGLRSLAREFREAADLLERGANEVA